MKRELSMTIFALALAAVPAAAQQGDPTRLSASEAAAAIRNGTLTSRVLIDALIATAEKRRDLNAFITLDPVKARAAADAADKTVAARGPLGPLHGVPIVVKDNINAAGWPTTAGTPALRSFVPTENAPALQKLLDAGGIVLGKANMHELAFGITSNNAAFGPVRNALAPDRFAGGSSGGTAVAVAAGMAPAGLGTDTGGSSRIPASLNGIVGFRPTLGRYPQAGVVPISHTRDTVGPMARTVGDAALLDGLITGSDTTLAPASLSGLRFGLATPFVSGLDSETARVFGAAIAELKKAGADIVPVDASDIASLNDKIGFPIALYEVRGDLDAFVKRYGAVPDIKAVGAGVVSPDVKFVFDNLVLGDKAIPEAVYRDALNRDRPALIAAYAKLFSDNRLDALVFPTTPLPAQPIATSDENVMLNGKSVPTFPTFIRNTDPGSNAGLPGLSIPIGMTKDGLPVGLEFDGPSQSDRKMLAIGAALEDLMKGAGK